MESVGTQGVKHESSGRQMTIKIDRRTKSSGQLLTFPMHINEFQILGVFVNKEFYDAAH